MSILKKRNIKEINSDSFPVGVDTLEINNTLMCHGNEENDRNLACGLYLNIPEGKTLILQNIDIYNVFIGVMKKGDGIVKVKRITLRSFGGDALNIRGNNLYIEKLIVRDSTPTRPYSAITLGNSIPLPASVSGSEGNPLMSCSDNIDDKIVEENQRIFSENQRTSNSSKKKNYLYIHNRNIAVCQNYQGRFVLSGYHVDAGLQAFREIPPGDRSRVSTEAMIELADNLYKDPLFIFDGKIEEYEEMIFESFTKRPHKLILEGANKVKEVVFLTERYLLSLYYKGELINQLKLIEGTQATGYTGSKYLTKYFSNSKNHIAYINSLVGSSNTGISNITIKELDIQAAKPDVQIISLTEPQQYQYFDIGREKIQIHSDHFYWFDANSLENSTIGGSNNAIVWGSPRDGKKPKIRVRQGGYCGSDYLCGKSSPYVSLDVTISQISGDHEYNGNYVTIV